jgi:hypothetical protein
MGINLMDLGNFATGAIERDREITNENLAVRAEELKANRDLMIAMKKDKYAADIANYKAEKQKSNEIQKLNSVAAKGDMDKSSYAKQYLLHSLGTEKFNALQKSDPEGFLDMVANISSARDYKFTTDRESIDNQFSVDTKIVNKGFADAIENAKGDSFLINKILRKKSNTNDNVNANIEEQLKAAKIVKEETVDGIDVSSIVLKDTAKRLRKPNNEYQTEWKNQRGSINFDLSKDNNNTFKFLEKTAMLGGNDDISYKFNKTDSKIEGMNAPAITNLLAMEYMFNEVKNSDDTMTLHYNNVTKNQGDIGKTWNADSVYKKMSNLLDGRGGNISENGLDLRTDIRLTTFVPLSLVNQNNKMVFGNGTVIDFKDKSKMKNLSNTMNDYILEKANAMYSNNKSVDEQSQASIAYERLYTGDANTISEFINYAATKNPELFKDVSTAVKAEGELEGEVEGEVSSTDKTIIDNKPKKTKSKVKFTIVKEDGKDGLAANGVFKSWEDLEKNDKIKLLGEVEKLAYDSWKATQNKEIKTNNPSYKQETKPDIVTPVIKSTIKKIDNFGKTIAETEGDFGTGA